MTDKDRVAVVKKRVLAQLDVADKKLTDVMLSLDEIYKLTGGLYGSTKNIREAIRLVTESAVQAASIEK